MTRLISPTLREVVRASVGVMGESGLGITEKVAFLGGKVKRFRAVGSGGASTGEGSSGLAQITARCEYLVPVRAYLYTKRIKFVLCDYYPLGSLADLLSGAREYGHTTLDWNQRLKIMITATQAILFVHSQSPSQEKKMQMNVHGNIKSSNIMVNVDFSVCLSEYGFVQVSEQVEQACDMESITPCHDLSQPGDIYNFVLVMLDMLAGPRSKHPTLVEFAREKKEEIRDGSADFFEFPVDGTGRNQALDVLEIALACLNKAEGSRP